MRYQVKKQYGRGAELPCAQFGDMTDAEIFIQAKLTADAAMDVQVTYKVFEGIDEIKSYSPDKTGNVAGSSANNSSAAAGSRPSPFNTAPRPPGTPQKWWPDEDDKEK